MTGAFVDSVLRTRGLHAGRATSAAIGESTRPVSARDSHSRRELVFPRVVNRAPLLQARELECLLRTARGKTKGEIATILGLSQRTVKFHLDAARAKLDASNTTQAVARVVVSGLLGRDF